MTNVVPFTGLTKLDLNPDSILENAVGNLTDVVVLGTDKDGNEYFACSSGDSAVVLWHLEAAKAVLISNAFAHYDELE